MPKDSPAGKGGLFKDLTTKKWVRPKGVREHIRRMGGEDLEVYLERLHQIAMGRKTKNVHVQMAALTWLLERVYGKTPQVQLNVEVDSNDVIDFTKPGVAERAAELTRQLEGLRYLSGGDGDPGEPRKVEALPAPRPPEREAPASGGGDDAAADGEPPAGGR